MSNGPLSEHAHTSQQRRDLLAQLVRQAASPASASAGLSHGQSALWFTHQLAPQSWAYHVVFSARVCSEVDESLLRQSLQALLDRHSILRTTYSCCDGAPAACLYEEMAVDFDVVQTPAASWDDVRERLVADVRQPFDLERGPLLRARLYRRAEADAMLVLAIHHIAVDFWSLGILLQELRDVYAALRAGQPVSLPPLWVTYDNFVRQQADMLARGQGEQLRAYWLQQLAGEPPALELPLDRPRPRVQTYRGASHAFELSPALTDALHALAQGEGVTLYMVLLAALQILLYRYSGQEDIWVGSPMARRSRPSFRRLVGYCVNPVVMRANLSGRPTFQAFLSQVRRTVLEALQHAEYPFPLLVEQLQPQRDAGRSPLFQVSLALQMLPQEPALLPCFMPASGPPQPIDFGDLTLEPYPLPQQEGQFDIGFEMAQVGSSLCGLLHYNADLFDDATAARMAQHFTVLLESAAAHPDECVDALPLMTAAERRQLTVSWNDTQTAYPLDLCLHQLVEAQVERTPDRLAVVYQDETLTYRELNRKADQLARYLRASGVGPEVLVGICVERSIEMVVGLLGILKAGGAYVPLDPGYPRERLAFMLSDAQPPVLLTQQRLAPLLPEHGAKVCCLDADWPAVVREGRDEGSATREATADNLAYVIYTSGSTGKPKGAMNTHRGICNRLLWMQDAYALGPDDRVLQKTPFSFDVSVWEFFWPLITGARLVVARPGGHLDSKYLVRLIAAQQITTLHFVPSMLQIFLDEPELHTCTALRRVICSGEALPLALQQRFFNRLDVELHNLYGPTEAAIDVTFWACQRHSEKALVPIGKPIANTQIYVLDGALQPTPIGAPGELHIGGVGVARGYLKRPELSAEKFIADPFSEEPEARLYKTGDLARYLPDGNIEFLGRLDDQVKLRGFRIELSEIETVLRQHPEVHDAVVVTRDAPSGHQQLVAYVVADKIDCGAARERDAHAAATLSAALRQFLLQKLPDYMVPAAFVALGAIPLTPNGKIDRRALPAPEIARLGAADACVAPRTPAEERLAPIWRRVLGLESISVDDNFFELGGHSLQAMQLLSQASAELQRDIPAHALFLHPTIADLAQALDAFPALASEPPSVAARAMSAPMQPTSPCMTYERRALTPRFASGELSPVQAAALAYLPTSLVSLTGASRDLILRDWCGQRPCVASVLDTHWGRLALIVLPVWGDDLYRDPQALRAMAVEGLALAGDIGARAVSLTGLLPSATRYGHGLVEALPGGRDWPSVSTGHATTTSAIVLTMDKLLCEGGRRLTDERVGFLGLGSIGRAALSLMLNVLPHPAEIVLCDVYAKRQSLEAQAQALCEREGFQGRVRIATAEPEVPDAFYDATLIVGAANVPNILDVDRLRPGAMIVDDSAPHCFDPQRAAQRLRQRRDLLFSEGGLLRSPHAFRELRYAPPIVEQTMTAEQFDALFMRRDPYEIMGCTLSSLLSARFAQLPPTVGFVDTQTSQDYYGLLKRLGFEAAQLQCADWVLSEEIGRAFRRQFGAW